MSFIKTLKLVRIELNELVEESCQFASTQKKYGKELNSICAVMNTAVF